MNNKSKRLFFMFLALLLVLPVIVIAVSGLTAQQEDGEITGCYEFDACLYMNPLSSFMPPAKGFMPYVYGLGQDALIIANTASGDIQRFSGRYEKTPVPADELSSKADFEFIPLPDLSRYRTRWLRAEFSSHYRLYQLDSEVWLVQQSNDRIWSIYRLVRTTGTTLDDLNRAFETLDGSKELPQLTLKDVYALARRGGSLTTGDFDRFNSRAAGTGFMLRRYDIQGGCVLVVHADTPDSAINYARLTKQGYDPFDETLAVDIREGAEAVAAYLNPLHSLAKLTIEDGRGGMLPRELIYEFGGYRYYLNSTRADRVFVTFDYGDRLPIKQALEERRLTIEDAVANGLLNVSMAPSDNPLGGEFAILHHRHTFSFDDEPFYPSASFMYVVYGDSFVTYFDLSELADILSLQGRDALAEKLREILKSDSDTVIGGKPYIKDSELMALGISADVGWALSSHTPVIFSSKTS